MATAFLSALANVPWGHVIDLAPKLVEQAQRLRFSVKEEARDAARPSSEIEDLRGQIARLAKDNAELRADLGQASESLSSLANTNQLLVAKLTQWQRWFTAIACASGLTLVMSLVAIFK